MSERVHPCDIDGCIDTSFGPQANLDGCMVSARCRVDMDDSGEYVYSAKSALRPVQQGYFADTRSGERAKIKPRSYRGIVSLDAVDEYKYMICFGTAKAYLSEGTAVS